MPAKCHTNQGNKRKPPAKRVLNEKRVLYKSLRAFSTAAKLYTMKLQTWKINFETEDEISLVKESPEYDQHEFSVFVNNMLQVDIHHFGWPSTSEVVSKIDLCLTTVPQIICQIESLLICQGISSELGSHGVVNHLLTSSSKSFQDKSIPTSVQYAARYIYVYR